MIKKLKIPKKIERFNVGDIVIYKWKNNLGEEQNQTNIDLREAQEVVEAKDFLCEGYIGQVIYLKNSKQPYSSQNFKLVKNGSNIKNVRKAFKK